MKSVFGTAAALAVVAALSSVALVGCSSESTPTKPEVMGSVGMKLRLGPGINVPSVDLFVYEGAVTPPALPAAVNLLPEYDPRTIPTPGGGSDFNFALSLPPIVNSDGSFSPRTYHVVLKASTAAGAPHPVDCYGSGNVTINANQSAEMTITLTCDDRIQNGTERFDVNVVSNACPLEVEFVSASPRHIRIAQGEVGTLSATVQDDVVGTPFDYIWSSTGGGTFAPQTGTTGVNPAVLDSVFTCGQAGQNIVITLTATRQADADGPSCSDSLSVLVDCVSNACGNSVIDTTLNETCDDGDGGASDPTPLVKNGDAGACPNDCQERCNDATLDRGEECEFPPPTYTNPACDPLTCQLLPFCGDSTVDTGAGETCDNGALNSNAPGTTGVGGTCRATASGTFMACTWAGCLDGIQDPGEACDDGNNVNTDGCTNVCTIPVAPLVCGNGIVQPPTEACDYGTTPPTAPFSIPNCSDDMCAPIEDAACTSCMTGCTFYDCNTMTGNSPAGTNPGAGLPRAQNCRALLDCVYDTNCAASGDISNCYCGTGDCPAGGANGPCVTQVQAAAESTAYADINLRFGNTSYPVGRALQRVDCAISSSPSCMGPCSIN